MLEQNDFMPENLLNLSTRKKVDAEILLTFSHVNELRESFIRYFFEFIVWVPRLVSHVTLLVLTFQSLILPLIGSADAFDITHLKFIIVKQTK